MFNALSPIRLFSRFFVIACLIAVAVPAGFAIGTDGPAYSASARGGGSNGGGGGSGDGRGNKVLECLGGLCIVITECDGPCYPPPDCEGPDCTTDSSTGTPVVSYKITPAGCQSNSCSVSENGKTMRCHSRKADEKMCVQKKI